MSLEQRLTSLIRAGRHVIDSDFDATAYQEWRREAGKCVRELLGPDKGGLGTAPFECGRTWCEREKPHS